jgi:hypothetical protein
MKTYDPAPQDVHTRLAALIEKFHPDLKTSTARIDLLFVWAEEGQTPLQCHGYPAQAVVRIIGDKDRVAGRGDAEIVIDRENYQMLSEAEKDALLDHELYHLIVKKDRHGIIQVDDHRRPKMKMRRHDHEFGWFDEIARRHGEHSAEIQQARAFSEVRGQLYLQLDAAPTPAPDLHA